MTLIFAFGVALLLSLFLTPVTAYFARKYKFVDDPKIHRHPAILHKKIIPRAGGIPVYLALLISSLLFLPMSQKIIGIYLGGLILVCVGIIDDRHDLGKSVKLLSQIVSALIVVFFGVGIAFITNPLSFILTMPGAEVIRLDTIRIVFNFFGEHSILILADLFAVLWIVWVINMVNFSSGVDGQMPGIVLITLLVLFIASLRFGATDPSQLVVSKLAAAGIGATLGFLFFNFYPARIFPGDSGSYFLGYLVAVIAILSGAKVGTAILVMAVPLVDGVFTVIRRITMKKSPFLGDRSHLQHKLLDLGLTQRQVALFYWGLCAILGAVALSLNSRGKSFALLVIAVIILGGLLWLNSNLPQKGQK